MSASLDIDQVRKQEFKPFTKNISPSFGFDKTIHWFRIDVNNQSTQAEWLIELAYAPLDYMEIYFQGEDGRWQKKISGDVFPISSRTIKHRNYVFPLTIPSDDYSIYISN